MNMRGKNQTHYAGVAASRRRGSVLLLVVAVLVLIFILGLMLMQIARLDRVGTNNLAQTQDLDLVQTSGIAAIGLTLKTDLGINENGTTSVGTDDKIFDKDILNNTDASTGADNKLDQEPYDYPYTNIAAPGVRDDMWLASSSVNPTTGTTWNHISMIGDKNTKFADGTLPTVLTTQSDVLATDVQLPSVAINTATGVLADADGDGITDSKWAPMPVPVLHGLKYFWAVRVVDNSSMINVNTTLSEVNASVAYDASATGADAPHWWYPSDLDLGGFALGFGSPAGELQKMLGYRLNMGTAPLPTPWNSGGATDRRLFWTGFGRLYGYSGFYPANYGQFKIGDEMALRYRDGLNSSDTSPLIESSTHGLPTLLRASGTSGTLTIPRESSYKDALANLSKSTVADYFNYEPRHQMTTISGHAIFKPFIVGVDDAAGLSYRDRTLKRDINKLIDASDNIGAQTNPNPLMTEIKNVTSLGGNFSAPGGLAADTEFPYQFAADIIDYADADNKLTKITDANGKDRYGFEALPFIAEVYAQRYYAVTNVDTTAGFKATWTQQGDAGYVIEIRNPFRKVISLQNVHLWVDGVDWGALDTLSGKTTLAVDEVLELYHDSTGGTNDNVTALITGTSTNVAIGNTWSVNDNDITVELRATDENNNALTWGYSSTATAHGLPVSFITTPTSDPTGLNGYRQVDSAGSGDKINVLTVASSAFMKHDTLAPILGAYQTTTVEALGKSDKTGIGIAAGVPMDPTTNQFVFADLAGRLATRPIVQIGELAQIAAIPLDGTKSVGDEWASTGATLASQFMLNFNTTQLAGADNLAVPHAMLLMQRLTTLSPAEDGVDNNGDGNTDETGEQFVPGTININTVPPNLLQYILPIPDPTIRTSVANTIYAYREDPARHPNYRTGEKGIAMLGELMNLNATEPGLNNTDDFALNGTVVDFLSNPSSQTADGVHDDAEEKAMITRWLAQTCSTRSDVFTAYIVIRGYDNNGTYANPRVERRLIVVFDRSGVTSALSQVRVLGVYQY